MTAGKLKLMPDRGDGACINLNDLNLCNIYDARPEFCSITDMYYNYNLEEEENIITISSSLAEFNMKGDCTDGTGNTRANDNRWPKKMSMEEFKEWKKNNE